MFLVSKMTGHSRELSHENQKFSSPISTTQRDITTPITTVPTIILSNPTASTPFINPTSISDTYSPTVESPKRSSPPSSGASWCIASQSASRKALQIALDYACGYGGIDCSAIQAGQSCYNPNTIHDHASYAFNSYYQKNPVPNSCNFGGTAVITSTDPSMLLPSKAVSFLPYWLIMCSFTILSFFFFYLFSSFLFEGRGWERAEQDKAYFLLFGRCTSVIQSWTDSQN